LVPADTLPLSNLAGKCCLSQTLPSSSRGNSGEGAQANRTGNTVCRANGDKLATGPSMRKCVLESICRADQWQFFIVKISTFGCHNNGQVIIREPGSLLLIPWESWFVFQKEISQTKTPGRVSCPAEALGTADIWELLIAYGYFSGRNV